MTFQSLKNNYIDGLLETNAFLVKSINDDPFIKRNGEKSFMFLDHSKVASSPVAYKAFIDVMQFLLQQAYGENEYILCNVDTKISAQMVGSVAYNLNKPQIIYKSKELTAVEKGTKKQLTGDLRWNMPVAILDDVATGGDGTAKGIADLVLSEFNNIKDIQIFIGFVRSPSKTTYKTHYVLTRDELTDIIWKDLSPEQKDAVEAEKNL